MYILILFIRFDSTWPTLVVSRTSVRIPARATTELVTFSAAALYAFIYVS